MTSPPGNRRGPESCRTPSRSKEGRRRKHIGPHIAGQPGTQSAVPPVGAIVQRLHARGLTYAEIAEDFGLPLTKVLGLVWLAQRRRGGST